MALPSGAHYTDSSRHMVRLSSGETVTRAAAENMAARAQGFSTNYERRQAFKSMKATRGFERARAEAMRHGASRQEADNAYARLMADYKNNSNDYRRIDKSPDGPLAQWLRATGRKSDHTYTVGESP
jgi:hypothetical protein